MGNLISYCVGNKTPLKICAALREKYNSLACEIFRKHKQLT